MTLSVVFLEAKITPNSGTPYKIQSYDLQSNVKENVTNSASNKVKINTRLTER